MVRYPRQSRCSSRGLQSFGETFRDGVHRPSTRVDREFGEAVVNDWLALSRAERFTRRYPGKKRAVAREQVVERLRQE